MRCYQALRDVAIAVALLASPGARSDTDLVQKAALADDGVQVNSSQPVALDLMAQMFLPPDVVQATAPEISPRYEEVRSAVGNLSLDDQKLVYAAAQAVNIAPASEDPAEYIASQVVADNFVVTHRACQKAGFKQVVKPGQFPDNLDKDVYSLSPLEIIAQMKAQKKVNSLVRELWKKANIVVSVQTTQAPCANPVVFLKGRIDPATGEKHDVLQLPSTSSVDQVNMLTGFRDILKKKKSVNAVNDMCVFDPKSWVSTRNITDPKLASEFKNGRNAIKTMPQCFKFQKSAGLT